MEVLLLAAVLLISLLLIPIGLPGTWLMVAAAMGYDALMSGSIGAPIGWVSIGATTALALIAEVLEFSVSARYTRRYGGSRRAGWGAILGGIAGAFVGVPVPIVGSVIGAFAGAFVGALVLEYSRARDHAVATRVAWGALLGRVVAAAMKVGLGVVIGAWLIWAALV